MNRYYSDRLDLGHTDDVEGVGGHTQVNSIRYSGSWQVNRTLSLGLGLYYEDARIVNGSAVAGAVASDYTRYGANLSTGFQISQHLGLTLGYQYVNKSAVRESESYSQNRVTFSLGYRF